MPEPSNDLVAHFRKQMIRLLVQQAIVCPVTGEVLDVRTCVVTNDRDGDPKRVLSQDGWAQITDALKIRLAELGETVDESTVRK